MSPRNLLRLSSNGSFLSFLPPAFRRNGEGNVFTGVCPLHLRGGVHHPRSRQGGTPSQVKIGGYPTSGLDRGYIILLIWGVPIQDQDRGVPHPADGVPHPRSEWGVPHPRWGQGTPIIRMGYPLSAGWGTHSQGLDGVLSISRMGYPPVKDWMGYPPIGRIGYPQSRTEWDTSSLSGDRSS